MSLGYNVASLSSEVRVNLERTQSVGERMRRRLSSGLRINAAADDAAGTAVAERLRAKVRSMSRSERNMNDAISLVNTAEGGLGEIQGMLTRLRELAVQAADGTLNANDRQNINTEFQLVKDELQRTAEATTFKDINLLDGSIGATSFNDKSVDFDGINDHLRVRAPGKFDQGLTFSVWLQPESYPENPMLGAATYAAVASHHDGINPRGIYAVSLKADGSVSFSINGGEPVETESSAPLALDEWHHVAGVWDKKDDRVRLYVKGDQVSEVEAHGTKELIGPKGLFIGSKDLLPGTEFFDGKMDEVSVWNTDLADADISSVYNQGNPDNLLNHTQAADNLQIWYRMGDDESDSTQDGGVIKDQLGGADAKPVKMEADDIQADVPMAHVDFQVGTGTGDADTLRVRVDSAQIDDLGLTSANVSTASAASTAIGLVDSAMHRVSENRARVGATVNRLHTAVDSIQTNRTSAEASLSQVRDADFAETAAVLSRSMVGQQAAMSVLAQANQQSSLVLSLLG